MRERGHDVLWITEASPGEPDDGILAEAILADRVLLTFDLDFGELVFRQKVASNGIILLRIRSRNIDDLLARLGDAWPEIEARAAGHFVVVTASQIRLRPMS